MIGELNSALELVEKGDKHRPELAPRVRGPGNSECGLLTLKTRFYVLSELLHSSAVKAARGISNWRPDVIAEPMILENCQLQEDFVVLGEFEAAQQHSSSDPRSRSRPVASSRIELVPAGRVSAGGGQRREWKTPASVLRCEESRGPALWYCFPISDNTRHCDSYHKLRGRKVHPLEHSGYSSWPRTSFSPLRHGSKPRVCCLVLATEWSTAGKFSHRYRNENIAVVADHYNFYLGHSGNAIVCNIVTILFKIGVGISNHV